MATYLCGIDNGTTGTKAMIFSLDGNVVGEDYREYKCEFPKPGWVDQDAEMLLSASCAALKSAIARSGVNPKDIAAMGLSTQRCTMVPVDKECQPVRKAISWQDGRSTSECDWIRDNIGAEKYYDITGLPIIPVWALPAILWIRNNEPEVYERANKFLLMQEFILHRLGAEGYPEDWSNGSLQGLMEIDTFKWSTEILEASGLSLDQLPDLVPSAKMVGRVNKEAAQLTGLADGTPLVSGGGDQQCAGIGAGIIAEGLCEVTIGTAGVSLCFMDKPNRDPAMKMPCSAHAYPGKWECEGLQNAAGASYRWFRDTLAGFEIAIGEHIGTDPYELINKQVSKTPAGSRGLFYIPYLAGASAPNWDPYAKGSFIGLTLAHDYGCMARAVMEGISLETREITPVGGTRSIPVNTRILAATNRNLTEEVEQGRFREDLYYRLNVVEIALPALTERREDIPLLIEHFIKTLNRRFDRHVLGAEPAALAALLDYEWRGGVRELENIIERALTLCEGDHISFDCLPPAVSGRITSRGVLTLKESVARFEKTYIQRILGQTGGSKQEASRLLGIGLSSLYRKIDEHGID